VVVVVGAGILVTSVVVVGAGVLVISMAIDEVTYGVLVLLKGTGNDNVSLSSIPLPASSSALFSLLYC